MPSRRVGKVSSLSWVYCVIGQPNLLEIGGAEGAARVLAHLLEDGEQDGGNDHDDGDDHENLDQRKSFAVHGKTSRFLPPESP